MNTMAIIAHLVRILHMGSIDRSSKEVLHSKRFPGDSVLGFGGGSFQVPYGVLQCIREHKSFVARRVAGNRGLKRVSAGAAARKALSIYPFRRTSPVRVSSMNS